jgi:predicted RNA binding protein YcfA (HicA-like mRNA interferase family)
MERDSRIIIKRLLEDGFAPVATRGSHHKFHRQSDDRTVVGPHPRKDLPIGTARSIYRQAGWL